MRILMLQTRRISETGHDLRYLEKGWSGEVADSAARFAIRNGWAKEVEDAENDK